MGGASRRIALQNGQTDTPTPFKARPCAGGRGGGRRSSSSIICKNDLERLVHTLSGDAGADLLSRAGGVTRTPTTPRHSLLMTCAIPLPNHLLPSRWGRPVLDVLDFIDLNGFRPLPSLVINVTMNLSCRGLVQPLKENLLIKLTHNRATYPSSRLMSGYVAFGRASRRNEERRSPCAPAAGAVQSPFAQGRPVILAWTRPFCSRVLAALPRTNSKFGTASAAGARAGVDLNQSMAVRSQIAGQEAKLQLRKVNGKAQYASKTKALDTA